MRVKVLCLAVASALAIEGCSSNSSTADLQSGAFIDAPVQGLLYETTTGISGTTDAAGRFNFLSGDSVSFYVGGKDGINIGSARAAAIITPFDVSGNATKDLSNTRTLRVLQTLQSLDDDGDTSSVIKLATAGVGKCDLADSTLTDAKLAACAGKQLISDEQARLHFVRNIATGGLSEVKAVEFVGMDAPAMVDEKADAYTKAKIKLTYSDGSTATYDLKYYQIVSTGDTVGGSLVGGIYDSSGKAITDSNGPLYYDAPDANSLMRVPGLTSSNSTANPLALVTHFEYKELPPAGQTGSFWSKLPSGMGLTVLDQSKATGALTPVKYSNIDFSGVKGLWIACAGSLTPWNTHLGSEEYEPDAKVRGGGTKATGSDDGTDINSFSQYYLGNAASANPYHYGLVPEISVGSSGTPSVQKHYALGRFARELADVMPDNRTVYMGDDGAYTGLFMFVADKAGDLSAGTLYAGKWSQTSSTNGGAANLTWIKLGSATDAEIKALVDGGIKFSDIFDAANTDPADASYKKVRTYTGVEWLRLKPGKEKAAAFLETRRFAALQGATTEFTKMEGVTHDPKDKKAYVVISRIETGMLAQASDPADDIKLDRNDGGAIYELALTDGQKDTAGNPIGSSYVARTMASVPELLGGWNGGTKDAEGNQCAQDKVCGGDNLKFSPMARTLFIGEDTSRRNNNYVWAFNVDTRKLSRILSVPLNAEATGLQIVENQNGYAYIMSNFQHPGEDRGATFGADPLANYTGADKAAVLAAINSKWNNRKKTAIGYIGTSAGALPAFNVKK